MRADENGGCVCCCGKEWWMVYGAVGINPRVEISVGGLGGDRYKFI